MTGEGVFLPKGGDRWRKTLKVTSPKLKLSSKEVASSSRLRFVPKFDL